MTHSTLRSASALLIGPLVSLVHVPAAAAQADFTASVVSGPIPLVVQFEDVTPGAVQDAIWLFGEGPAFGFGKVVSYTYENPGTFDVSMTTYVGQPAQPVQVVKEGLIQADSVPVEPTFERSLIAGGVPLEVAFTDTTSGLAPTAWAWDFGDGCTSTEQHPVHVYTGVGTFDVSLEVTYYGVSGVGTVPGAVAVSPVVFWREPLTASAEPDSSVLLAADLDGDGRPDLVTAEESSSHANASTLHAWPNLGDGGFGPAATLLATLDVEDQVAGDLDLDGDADLLLSLRLQPESVQVVRSDGAFGVQSVQSHALTAGTGEPRLALFDADEDGALDLLTARPQRLELSLGDGLGAFAAPGPPLPVAALGAVQRVATADVNGDGHVDLISTSAFAFLPGVTWAVSLGDGAGGFTADPVVPDPDPAATFADGLVAGGFTGGGGPDAVLSSSDGVQLARGDGSVLTSHLPQDFVSGVGDVWSPADVDLDGVADLLSRQASFTAAPLLRLGGVDFPHAAQTMPTSVWSGVMVDADDDGKPDLVCLPVDGAGPADELQVWRNDSLPPGWSDAGGTLPGSAGPPTLVGSGALTAGAPTTLTLTDARPLALTALFVGVAPARLPFKGGTLVPSPDVVIVGAHTDAQGELVFTAPWPGGIGAGYCVWYQVWIQDPAGPKGAAASNAVGSRTP